MNNLPATRVRDIVVGERFVLRRSGEKYQLIEKKMHKGRMTYFVKKENETRERLKFKCLYRSRLNHQCQVKRIVKL